MIQQVQECLSKKIVMLKILITGSHEEPKEKNLQMLRTKSKKKTTQGIFQNSPI